MAGATRERDHQTPWLPEPRTEADTSGLDRDSRLGASFERFADRFAEALGTLLGAPFAGSLEATEAAGTFALFAEHDGHPAAVLRSDGFDARLALVWEPSVTHVSIASMFGVDPALDSSLPKLDATSRPCTELESRILGELSICAAKALNEAFAPAVSLEAVFEGLSTLVDTNLLGARDMPAIATRIQIKGAAGAFSLDLILPQSLTNDLSGGLSRGPELETVKLDPYWTRRMEQRVTEANLMLTAILDEFPTTLGEVANFKIGAVLPLSDDGQGQVRIECVERGVFICKLGERNQRYALEVEDIIAAPVEPAYPASAN